MSTIIHYQLKTKSKQAVNNQRGNIKIDAKTIVSQVTKLSKKKNTEKKAPEKDLKDKVDLCCEYSDSIACAQPQLAV